MAFDQAKSQALHAGIQALYDTIKKDKQAYDFVNDETIEIGDNKTSLRTKVRHHTNNAFKFILQLLQSCTEGNTSLEYTELSLRIFLLKHRELTRESCLDATFHPFFDLSKACLAIAGAVVEEHEAIATLLFPDITLVENILHVKNNNYKSVRELTETVTENQRVFPLHQYCTYDYQESTRSGAHKGLTHIPSTYKFHMKSRNEKMRECLNIMCGLKEAGEEAGSSPDADKSETEVLKHLADPDTRQPYVPDDNQAFMENTKALRKLYKEINSDETTASSLLIGLLENTESHQTLSGVIVNAYVIAEEQDDVALSAKILNVLVRINADNHMLSGLLDSLPKKYREIFARQVLPCLAENNVIQGLNDLTCLIRKAFPSWYNYAKVCNEIISESLLKKFIRHPQDINSIFRIYEFDGSGCLTHLDNEFFRKIIVDIDDLLNLSAERRLGLLLYQIYPTREQLTDLSSQEKNKLIGSFRSEFIKSMYKAYLDYNCSLNADIESKKTTSIPAASTIPEQQQVTVNSSTQQNEMPVNKTIDIQRLANLLNSEMSGEYISFHYNHSTISYIRSQIQSTADLIIVLAALSSEARAYFCKNILRNKLILQYIKTPQNLADVLKAIPMDERVCFCYDYLDSGVLNALILEDTDYIITPLIPEDTKVKFYNKVLDIDRKFSWDYRHEEAVETLKRIPPIICYAAVEEYRWDFSWKTENREQLIDILEALPAKVRLPFCACDDMRTKIRDLLVQKDDLLGMLELLPSKDRSDFCIDVYSIDNLIKFIKTNDDLIDILESLEDEVQRITLIKLISIHAQYHLPDPTDEVVKRTLLLSSSTQWLALWIEIWDIYRVLMFKTTEEFTFVNIDTDNYPDELRDKLQAILRLLDKNRCDDINQKEALERLNAEPLLLYTVLGILENTALNEANENNITLINHAAFEGLANVIWYLLMRGVDTNIRPHGWFARTTEQFVEINKDMQPMLPLFKQSQPLPKHPEITKYEAFLATPPAEIKEAEYLDNDLIPPQPKQTEKTEKQKLDDRKYYVACSIPGQLHKRISDPILCATLQLMMYQRLYTFCQQQYLQDDIRFEERHTWQRRADVLMESIAVKHNWKKCVEAAKHKPARKNVVISYMDSLYFASKTLNKE